MIFEWIRNFIGNAVVFCFAISLIALAGELFFYRWKRNSQKNED